jgi:hypothetical protein
MNGFRWAVGIALVVGFTGCGGSDEDTAAAAVMPDVVGLQLDVALSDIERAGFEDEVEVISDGMFGVVDESNWQVCEQLPAAGEAMTVAPRLEVDRSCEGDEPEPTTPPTTPETTAPEPTMPEPTTPPTTPEPTASEPPTGGTIQEPEASGSEETLTVENSADLAALLSGPGECDETVAIFATKYRDQVIEFDGNIAAMNNHGAYDTRYDILVYAGDYSEVTSIGPSFQFRDVGILDLNLVGANVPDFIGAGDNLRVIATVEEFDSNSCLFLLDPVSTEVR